MIAFTSCPFSLLEKQPWYNIDFSFRPWYSISRRLPSLFGFTSVMFGCHPTGFQSSGTIRPAAMNELHSRSVVTIQCRLMGCLTNGIYAVESKRHDHGMCESVMMPQGFGRGVNLSKHPSLGKSVAMIWTLSLSGVRWCSQLVSTLAVARTSPMLNCAYSIPMHL